MNSDEEEEYEPTPEDIGIEEDELLTIDEISDEVRERRNKRLNFFSECNSLSSVGGFNSGKVLMKLVGTNSGSSTMQLKEMDGDYKICGLQAYSPKYRQISL